jgi:hypothetical protein
MQTVIAYPPNFEAIVAAFPNATQRGVLFAYGSRIFNPSGVDIPPQFLAHESVHEQQHSDIGGPEGWWDRYIDDVEFRASQEVPAHAREYRVYCDIERDRNRRAKALHAIAVRLSGPLYGKVMTFGEARSKLLMGA